MVEYDYFLQIENKSMKSRILFSAEMIRRRQLFPGSSYIQQMKMIVSLLGSPSKELLKRCNSDQIQHFLRGLGQHSPVPLQRVFPEASEDSLDLLARILVLDPSVSAVASGNIEIRGRLGYFCISFTCNMFIMTVV